MKPAMVWPLHDNTVSLSHAENAATTGETRQPAERSNCDIGVMLCVRICAFWRGLWRYREQGYATSRMSARICALHNERRC
jgi:hypothetical protein